MTASSPIAKNFPVVLLAPVIEKHGGNGEAELATKLTRTSCEKILDKFFLMWFIALTLNQLGGPVYLLYPTNKTPPQEKIYRAFLSMKELFFLTLV